ncbi:hypothetical protein GCM10023189_46100 [Nibrella saemangeumensis]|uniref:Beta-lactamase-related domain-containing protein n=1 Tax=Nibrella saemangeumensis TaxID=1084526 RepID=A0ABP8NHB3_9BACT
MKTFIVKALPLVRVLSYTFFLTIALLITAATGDKRFPSYMNLVAQRNDLARKPIPPRILDRKRIAAVADSLARMYMSAGTVPGLTIAVAKDGEIVVARGYGKTDIEMGVAAHPDAVLKIGSITKQFTAAIIMRLVEAGKLELDDPITKYLPDYPVQGRLVTIHHLLNHTSGIRSYTGLDKAHRQREFRLDLSYAEMVNLFGKQPFDFEPGTKYQYNNSGYYLLGEIISRLTGMPYAEYVEHELLQPLGLTHTYYCDDRRIIQNRAKGYEFEGNKLTNTNYISMAIPGPAGALCSTVGDLVRWTHLLHSGKVVTPISLQLMTSPTVLESGDTLGYGYGLQLSEIGGYFQVYHGGSVNGFLSGLAHYPEAGLTVAVLTNSGKGSPGLLVKELARTALNAPMRDLPLTAQEVARYEGTYKYQSTVRTRDIRVFGENGKLHVQAAGLRPYRLLYQGNHTFIPTVDDDDRLIFSVTNGIAQGFKHHEGRWTVTPALRKP